MLRFYLPPLQILVLTVVNFVLSAVVFSPAMPWFAAWARAVGAEPGKKEMTKEEAKGMPLLFGGAIVSSFLMPAGLSVLVGSLGAATFLDGALLGLCAWLAFSVPQALNSRFEGRKPLVLLINGILYLVTWTLYGGMLAIWR